MGHLSIAFTAFCQARFAAGPWALVESFGSGNILYVFNQFLRRVGHKPMPGTTLAARNKG